MLTSFEYLAGWMKAKFGVTDRGAALVEYALLLALIAVVCIVALQVLGDSASDKFSNIGSEIDNAGVTP